MCLRRVQFSPVGQWTPENVVLSAFTPANVGTPSAWSPSNYADPYAAGGASATSPYYMQPKTPMFDYGAG
jgi:hypothetical protein